MAPCDNLLCVPAGGLAAITVIFITISMFLALLVAMLYRKYRRKVQEEQIYEYTPPNSSKKYLPPPPLPSPRITTNDNPAYERIPTMDSVAYASSSGLKNLDQQLTIHTQSSIVSVL